MVIEDTFTISAPIEKVWDFFLNIERLSTCMPGVEHVEQKDDTTYEGVLGAKVGPISARFSGVAEIVEQHPPNQIKASIKAKDKRTASMIKGGFDSTLTSINPTTTEVGYKIDVAIRGKMGQFGQTVIKDTALAISQVFIQNVRQELEEPIEIETTSAVTADSNVAPTPPQTKVNTDVNIVWLVIKSVFASIGRFIRNLFSSSQT